MAGSYACLYCHIVFSTKDRRPLTEPELAPRLYGYMAATIKGIGGVPIQLGGARDHAHVLAALEKTARCPHASATSRRMRRAGCMTSTRPCVRSGGRMGTAPSA